MNETKNMDFLCFGGEDWWYHNRGHIDFQLMRRFAKKGKTLYINSITMQKPKLGRNGKFITKLVRKTKSILKGLKKTEAGFWVYSPFSLPVHHIAWLRPLNTTILKLQLRLIIRRLQMHNPVVWVACPTACDIALKFKKQRLVYQRTDRFEAYPDVDINLIQQYDRELKANSDLTIFVNDKLYELEREQCKKAIYLDHGVDYDVFASAELNQDKPADIAKIPKPIVGYFGLLDAHKLNINFTKSLVELMPNVSFVFIGITTPQFAQLAKKENVWLLGQKPYEQIPHYGKCFDAAIFPANHNKWIKACNPIKLKEYLALGKPVISTSFPELREYSDVVYQANTPEKFARCLEKALAENSAERIAARRKKVQSATWASKAQLVMNELFVDNDN